MKDNSSILFLMIVLIILVGLGKIFSETEIKEMTEKVGFKDIILSEKLSFCNTFEKKNKKFLYNFY
jgi:hypothetical protein